MGEGVKKRFARYPETTLGEQQRPFEEAFSGWDMLRERFGKKPARHILEGADNAE